MPLDSLEGLGVFFSSPCHTGMTPVQYNVGIQEMHHVLRAHGVRYLGDSVIGESLVTRARNVQIHQFLCSPCTHMFIWDTDQKMEPASGLIELLKLDLPIVGVPVALKFRWDWERIAKSARAGVPAKELEKSGKNFAFVPLDTGMEIKDSLFEVKRIGTGCMLVKRETIETMLEAYPDDYFFIGEPSKANIPYPLLFDHMLDENRIYLSEDYSFCEKWRKIGGKIYAWCGADISHYGTYDYGGNFARYLEEHRQVGGGEITKVEWR